MGKSTLTQHILTSSGSKGLYLNWDFDEDRYAIMEKKWDQDHRLIVLDELHKYPPWKNWLKGIFDKNRHKHQFLITGSARLDVYRKGGDSLLGRYHYWRLHPLSLDELPPQMSVQEGLKRLMTVGGFPEPFLDGNEEEARRWRRSRFDRILKEDIRDLESIKKIQEMTLFTDILRRSVSQMVVLSNIAKKIQVSPRTANLWLEVLNRMYISFSIKPYTKKLARAIQKPPKVYFFDNADLILEQDEGPRFENLVASHLLKNIHFLEDKRGFRMELNYLRDKDGREVNFVILKDSKIFALVEAKLSENNISRSLRYYSEKLNPPHSIQIVYHLKQEYSQGRCRVLNIETALNVLFRG